MAPRVAAVTCVLVLERAMVVRRRQGSAREGEGHGSAQEGETSAMVPLVAAVTCVGWMEGRAKGR